MTDWVPAVSSSKGNSESSNPLSPILAVQFCPPTKENTSQGHQPKNTDVLIQLLHDDFMEFCRFDVCVNKTDTINNLTNDNSNIAIY